METETSPRKPSIFISHTARGLEAVAELRQHLTAEGPVVIKGKRTIHGMGGVGKTRAHPADQSLWIIR